jgi:putative peptidoglycan lipid II flippase
MIERILTVGGFTLLSRLTGFVRDIVLAYFLGAGPLADAFIVAWRLPNHFRSIFAEGAFNAAFVPAYARVRQQQGEKAVHLFGDRVFTLMAAVQVVVLLLALSFMPIVVETLAPGFTHDADRFALAVEFTRITFPSLMLLTLVTLLSGILNARERFAAAAAAPILLNVTMIATLACGFLFPSMGHAAAWGVLLAGVFELALVAGDAAFIGAMPRLRMLRWDEAVKRFFVALGPAVIGRSGGQLAVLADTIIASFLVRGAVSALYFADRINQIPIGVVGIAAGTVVLPEMARRIAAGDEAGAHNAQNRAIELTLLLSAPCVAAFLVIPALIMRALFVRGAFTDADAAAASATLAAYTIGLMPFVLIQSVTATFLARGDTATPMKAALAGAFVNIVLKVVLMGPLAQVGLALATAVGGWINFGLVLWFAARAGLFQVDQRLRSSVAKIAGAALVLALALWLAQGPVLELCRTLPKLRDVAALATLAVIGAIVYGGLIAVSFGREWRALLRRR